MGMIQAFPRYDSWEPQLLQCLLDTATWKFLYAMQETSGTDAKDYSGNGYTGTYANVALNQNAPNHRINKMVGFNGSSSKVAIPVTASVRGLATVTLIAVVNVTDQAGLQTVMQENVNDGTGTRLNMRINSDGKLSINVRSNVNAQTAQTKTSFATCPLGVCMLHATIDIANDSIAIYRNGVALSTTGTINFGEDITFADTEPSATPKIGGVTSNTYLNGAIAYLGVATSILSDATILQHAKAGGFV